MKVYLGISLAARSILSIALLFSLALISHAQDLSETKKLFRQGKFNKVIELAGAASEKDPNRLEDWIVLQCQAQLETGRYEEAKRTVETGLSAFRYSIRIREVAVEIFRFNKDDSRSDELRKEINELWKRNSWRYRRVEDLMVVGRLFLAEGIDPKKVLDQLYKPASAELPDSPEVEIAIAELALSKNDYQLAAKHFQKAIKLDDADPRSHLGLVQAFRPSDEKLATKSLNRVFKIDANHTGARLIQIEQLISAESYDEAEKVIEKVLAVNPHQPDAWSYRAVLAHLAGKHDEEARCLSEALKHWPSNPRVDHLVGLQLSRKYRFTESVTYQRRALVMDAGYVPAKIQLAHDLLRLGQELEGWKLAEQSGGSARQPREIRDAPRRWIRCANGAERSRHLRSTSSRLAGRC